MNSWANTLFYVVFLSQILLTSYLVPRLLSARMYRLLEAYPPDRYPKLYPRPVEYHRMGHALFRWANRCVLLLGFVVLYGVYALDGGRVADDGYISEAWPAGYGVLQFMPLMAMELMGFRQFQLMREANTNRTRKATLRPRRLFDYVSTPLAMVTVVLMAAFVGQAFYMQEFRPSLGSDATQQMLVMMATNLGLVVMGLWQLHGRRLDPYQKAEDRARKTRVQLTSLFLVSCALSVFLTMKSASAAFDLHFLDAPLISIYFQIIVAFSIGYFLRSLRMEDMDFSVYANTAESESTHV